MNIFVLGMYRHFDLSTPLILIQEDEKDPKIHYVWIAFDAYYSDITHFIIGLFLELDSDNKIVRKTVQHYRWGVVCSISEVGWFDPREANDADLVKTRRVLSQALLSAQAISFGPKVKNILESIYQGLSRIATPDRSRFPTSLCGFLFSTSFRPSYPFKHLNKTARIVQLWLRRTKKKK